MSANEYNNFGHKGKQTEHLPEEEGIYTYHTIYLEQLLTVINS